MCQHSPGWGENGCGTGQLSELHRSEVASSRAAGDYYHHRQGRNVNAALKSDIMRTVSKPPILAFSCTLAHHTALNIIEQHEFAVNVPGENIAEQAMETAKDYPREVNELEKAGLHAIPSHVVKPPRILECPVNLECTEEWHKTYGEEIIIFGCVVAASIDEDIFQARCEERFQKVRPMALLGEYRYCPISNIKKLPRGN